MKHFQFAWPIAWPALPVLRDPYELQRALLFQKILRVLVTAHLLIALPVAVATVNERLLLIGWLGICATFLMAGWLFERGQLSRAIWLFVIGIIIPVVISNSFVSTDQATDAPVLLVVVVLGSILLDFRGVAGCVIANIIALWVIAIIRQINFPNISPIYLAAGHTMVGTGLIALIGTLGAILRRNWLEALIKSRINEVSLAEKNAVLAEQNLILAERTQQVSALLEVGNRIGSALELDTLIPLVLESLKLVLPYDNALVVEFRSATMLHALGYVGPDKIIGNAWEYVPERDLHLKEMFRTRAPVIIPDVEADEPKAIARRTQAERDIGRLPDYIRSTMYVPLHGRSETVGYLTLNSAKKNCYTERHVALSKPLATQVAMCIENARLHERATQTAALAERNRIARELHDSVSQALFGIVLGMRTMMEVSNSRKAPPEEAMNYVMGLADAALQEIRALIFELRPEYLEKEGLQAAMKRQVEGLCARHHIAVQTQFDIVNEPQLSGKAKEAIYRIGLEAIRNTIKHANASKVNVSLSQHNSAVVLEIKDDGRGFDPNVTYTGHLGMVSMRERAEQFGGQFEVSSDRGRGTLIRVSVPFPA